MDHIIRSFLEQYFPDASQEESSFPHEVWDEMYDSAFEAIQDVSFVDFFNEQ